MMATSPDPAAGVGPATLMTKQLLVEDTVDEWLEPVMVTVDADRQLPLDRLARGPPLFLGCCVLK